MVCNGVTIDDQRCLTDPQKNLYLVDLLCAESAGAGPWAKPFALWEGEPERSAEVCILNLTLTWRFVYCSRYMLSQHTYLFEFRPVMSLSKSLSTTASYFSYTFRPLFNVGFVAAFPPQLADTNTGKLPSNCVADHGAKIQPCRLWVRPLRGR